jgi:integrase
MPKDWTSKQVEAARHPGVKTGAKPVPVLFRVSRGLYLQVTPGQSKQWVHRFMLGGKARHMGLGPYPAVGLADARAKVADADRMRASKVDPLAARRDAAASAAQAAQAAAGRHTFQAVADIYIAAHEASWRNAKHRQQWTNTLTAYVHPKMGALPVESIGTGEVMTVLEPIWHAKPETASRVRGRIEAILDYATARGWRQGENPARWRGHMANLLPKRSKVRAVVHHAACPWQEVGAFMADLEAREGMAALALRFLILTAARTSEVTGARWSEIDLTAKVWTVPASRMKAGREHRVPLSDEALAILAAVAPLRDAHDPSALVFPARADRPLSAMAFAMLLRRMNPEAPGKPARYRDRRTGEAITAHGFRSTFRDWCAETVAVPREVAEAALAHTVRDKVEAAYQRADLLERRRPLMAEWARFLAKPLQPADVADLAEARRMRATA